MTFGEGFAVRIKFALLYYYYEISPENFQEYNADILMTNGIEE